VQSCCSIDQAGSGYALVCSEDRSALKNWWMRLRPEVKGTELVEQFDCIGPGATVSVLACLSLGQGFGRGMVTGVMGEDRLLF